MLGASTPASIRQQLSPGTPIYYSTPATQDANGGNAGTQIDFDIQPGQDLMFESVSATARTITVTPRGNSSNTFLRYLPAGQTAVTTAPKIIIRGAAFSHAKLSAADSNVSWAIGPEGCFPA